MATQLISGYRDGAEVYQGEALCKQKFLQLWDEISLPKGLLPLDDIVEVGHNQSAGFIWLRQNRKKEHKFQRISRIVSYDVEVTAFVENRRLKKLTGVKTKELLIWLSISDIYINDPSSGKITFGTPAGISRSFPVSAFELEDNNNDGQKSEN